MDILPGGNIFRELENICQNGTFSSQTSLEDQWQQVCQYLTYKYFYLLYYYFVLFIHHFKLFELDLHILYMTHFTFFFLNCSITSFYCIADNIPCVSQSLCCIEPLYEFIRYYSFSLIFF